MRSNVFLLQEKGLYEPNFVALGTRLEAFGKKYCGYPPPGMKHSTRYETLILHQLQLVPLPRSTQQPGPLFTLLKSLFASYQHYLISSLNRPRKWQALLLCLTTPPALALHNPLLDNPGSPELQNTSPTSTQCQVEHRGKECRFPETRAEKDPEAAHLSFENTLSGAEGLQVSTNDAVCNKMALILSTGVATRKISLCKGT